MPIMKKIYIFYINFFRPHRPYLTVISGVAVICRVGLNSKQTKVAVSMFLNIVPVMFDLMSLVFVIMLVASSLTFLSFIFLAVLFYFYFKITILLI